jgi:hypothetical protein
MVAFVNTSMIKLAEAMSKISGGAQLGDVGMAMLYLALGIMSIGYYFLFSKISFSTRGLAVSRLSVLVDIHSVVPSGSIS